MFRSTPGLAVQDGFETLDSADGYGRQGPEAMAPRGRGWREQQEKLEDEVTTVSGGSEGW